MAISVERTGQCLGIIAAPVLIGPESSGNGGIGAPVRLEEPRYIQSQFALKVLQRGGSRYLERFLAMLAQKDQDWQAEQPLWS